MNLLLVGLGGFLGSVARYLLGSWIGMAPDRFPLATLLVNLLGCLLIGILTGLSERSGFPGQEARLFLMTGLLGGFTTFSTFGLETLGLLRRGDWWLATGYVSASLLLGLLLVLAGIKLAHLLAG